MSPSQRPSAPFSYLPLLVSALCAAIAAQMAWREPRYLIPFLAIALVTLLPGYLARRRMRRLLMSGDVKRVLGTWQGSVARVMYPETMAPLMAATAYAAYGWTYAARSALERAARGPGWEAALEQRLFVETLLDTFEGDRTAALAKGEALERMPVPPAGPLARKRIALLRRGVSALARAFAHKSRDADGELLQRVASLSPLVHWAMRYAAAVVAVDQGHKDDARALLSNAPAWPKESAFHFYHDELIERVGS